LNLWEPRCPAIYYG